MLPATIADKYLLIDGDVLRYRCGWAAHPLTKDGQETDFGFDHVREFIDVSIGSLARTGSHPTGEIWLSGPSNFREAIGKSKPYKGNRKGRLKPRYFEEIGTYLVNEYGAQITEGNEADDQLGIGLTRDPKGSCVVSIDKDLLQVSGWHYNFVKHQTRWISRKAGDFNLYTQILSGDTGDNIPGVRGIGASRAAKLLEGSESSRELCQRAWDAYRTNGLSRDYFIEQASLVYIQRWPDDHYKVPIEWSEST